MRNKILLAIIWLFSSAAIAKENIFLVLPYNAGYSGQPALTKVLDQANKNQDRFNFIMDFRPGAGGLISYLQATERPDDRLVMLAPGAVDLFETQKIQETDWIPVHATGDSCGAIITNWTADENSGIKSMKKPSDQKTLNIGAVGLGSVSHLTGLEIARALDISPNTILFKSGREALLSLAGNQGVHITVDSVQGALGMQARNPTVKMIATMCDQRHPLAPHVPTAIEQKISIPPVFNIVMAHKEMPLSKARQLGEILDQATKDVGASEIFNLSGFRPAIFSNQSVSDFYKKRIGQIKSLRKTHIQSIRGDNNNHK